MSCLCLCYFCAFVSFNPAVSLSRRARSTRFVRCRIHMCVKERVETCVLCVSVPCYVSSPPTVAEFLEGSDSFPLALTLSVSVVCARSRVDACWYSYACSSSVRVFYGRSYLFTHIPHTPHNLSLAVCREGRGRGGGG